jgi:hypothetical protein
MVDDGSTPPPANKTELERAAEHFRIETEALGLRPGQSDALHESKASRPVWHGRLFENFRNNLLDAIPHKTKQGIQSTLAQAEDDLRQIDSLTAKTFLIEKRREKP